jgi:hypothetical protein
MIHTQDYTIRTNALFLHKAINNLILIDPSMNVIIAGVEKCTSN